MRPSILLWGTGALVATYALAAFIVGPAMFSDSGTGMLVAESMGLGAPFNHLLAPSPGDLGRDVSAFLTLWAPGQYVVPLAFETLGLPLGSALVATTTLFTALGLVGWHGLYRIWGFSPLVAATAMALTAGTRALALPFGIYNGGEVLLFGTAPWFLLLLWRGRSLALPQAAAILAGMAVVTFMKLSGAVLACAALAAIAVYDLRPLSRARLRRPLMAGLVGACFWLGLQAAWLSHGLTAATGVSGRTALVWADLVPRFVEGWGATFLGMLSLGDLGQRLFLHPPDPILASLDKAYLLAGIPALLLMAFLCRRLVRSHAGYVRFAVALALLYIGAMTVIYATGGSLGMGERFFRPLSLVLLVGMVEAVARLCRPFSLPFAALASAAMVYGVGSAVVHVRHNLDSPLSARGFRHQVLTADGLALVKQELAGPFDRADTLVWTISPEIALEIPQARFIPTGETADELRAHSYKGRTGKVFVLVPAALVADGRAEVMLKAFRDYDPKAWVEKKRGDFSLYAQ